MGGGSGCTQCECTECHQSMYLKNSKFYVLYFTTTKKKKIPWHKIRHSEFNDQVQWVHFTTIKCNQGSFTHSININCAISMSSMG